MRQAITTKYLEPTDHRGARIKATAEAGTITVHWDHALDIAPNHIAAAFELAEMLGWEGEWLGGSTKDGYVFVCSGRAAFAVGELSR